MHAALDLEVILRRMKLFGIWQIENVQQIHALSVPTLPAPETFNFFFKSTNHYTKLNICMRPWIFQMIKTDLKTLQIIKNAQNKINNVLETFQNIKKYKMQKHN